MGGCDPSTLSDSQYCYTIPDSYYYYDYYDYDEDWYHGSEEIQAGGTITMSKKCAPDFHLPGLYYHKEENYGNYGCDFYADACRYHPEFLLLIAAHTDNGYITILNCPQCGCTEDDIITLDEREAGTRTMGGGRAAFKAMLEDKKAMLEDKK